MAFEIEFVPEVDENKDWTGIMSVNVSCEPDDNLSSLAYRQVASLVSRLGYVLQFFEENPDIASEFFEYTNVHNVHKDSTIQ